MNNHATTPPPEPPTKTRLVLTFEDSKLVSTQVLTNSEHVLNFDEFRDYLLHAGFSPVPKAIDDYLHCAATAMGVGHV